jgi:hypothetical protein
MVSSEAITAESCRQTRNASTRDAEYLTASDLQLSRF